MGGTKILAALINSSEGIVSRLKRPTDTDSGRQAYVNSLASIIKDLVADTHHSQDEIAAVALGVPGAVNPYEGVIRLAPNLNLRNFNIRKSLQELIPYPVLLENDVNLGAMGIKKFGVGKKAKNMLAVFIGTGIGGGIIIDEKIYRGSDFVAGEIGHIKVKADGPVCGCGQRGCFETFASRTAIVNKIIDDIKAGKKSSVSKTFNSGQKIKSKAISAAIKANDKLVIRHISDACHTIGMVIASQCTLMNYDMIVLGGGLIEAAGSFMLPKIKDSFNYYVLAESAKKLKILTSKLADDAALFGGIALTEEFTGERV